MLAMGGTLWLAMGDAESWMHWSLTERLIRLTAIVLLGAASYFGALWLVGFRVKDFRRKASE